MVLGAGAAVLGGLVPFQVLPVVGIADEGGAAAVGVEERLDLSAGLRRDHGGQGRRAIGTDATELQGLLAPLLPLIRLRPVRIQRLGPHVCHHREHIHRGGARGIRQECLRGLEVLVRRPAPSTVEGDEDQPRGLQRHRPLLHGIRQHRRPPGQRLVGEGPPRGEGAAQRDAPLRLARADQQPLGEQLLAALLLLPGRQALGAERRPRSVLDLGGDRDAPGVDDAAELLPRGGIGEQIAVGGATIGAAQRARSAREALHHSCRLHAQTLSRGSDTACVVLPLTGASACSPSAWWAWSRREALARGSWPPKRGSKTC
ncbi:hypothetical protein QDR37_07840 [Amnibacterium sp. CER49]|uniref:hypothetical protein n=1 Tax=Amnibacterium sp. CER49 TaxID=3039161 RepID=UPI00244A3F7E|nr:hypothetical protein [Amnibacterium sp. CER49]MDH2443850.1 hypothetical protein [Amnibacterium sp. CER49]